MAKRIKVEKVTVTKCLELIEKWTDEGIDQFHQSILANTGEKNVIANHMAKKLWLFLHKGEE